METEPTPEAAPKRETVKADLATMQLRLAKTRTVKIPYGDVDLEFDVRRLTAYEESQVRVHMQGAIPPVKIETSIDPITKDRIETPTVDMANPAFRDAMERLFGEGKTLAVYLGCPIFQVEGAHAINGVLDPKRVSDHVLKYLPSLGVLDALFEAVLPQSQADAGAHMAFFSRGESPLA